MKSKLLDDKICKALDAAKERVRSRNKDFVCLVGGQEGNGKSSLAIEMAMYMDSDFDVETQVVMDHEDLIRTADDLDSYSAIVFDEGIEALLSRNHGKKKNKKMIEWFREVRAKNLFIFVCMPEFKEIEKPIRDDRAHALVRCVKQGWAHFYNQKKMNKITVQRKGNRVLADYPSPLFRGAWKDPEGKSFWSEYLDMKSENVSNLAEKYLGDDEEEEEIKPALIGRLLWRYSGMTQAEAAETVEDELDLGCSQSAVAKADLDS